MSENNQNLNIGDILGLIQDANKTLEHDVFIPSLNKTIHLKPLNANHSKNIAKSAIDGPFAQNQFTLIMYNILKEVGDSTVPLSHINILDKTVLMLELRAKNIGPQVEVKLLSDKIYTDVDGKQFKKESTIKVDLHKLLNKVKKFKLEFVDQIIELDNYRLILNYPSVEEEYQFESYIRSKMQKIDPKDQKALEALFNPMYVVALAQYVKSIKVGDQEIDLQTKKIDERLAIVETLSMNANYKIIDLIDSFFGRQINKILDVRETIDDESYSGHIDLSPILFLA